MPDDIARYEEMFSTEELVARAELFGLSTGGSKRDLIGRILTANVSFWGSREQERLLNIERASRIYTPEEAQAACSRAALPAGGTLGELCTRLVDAELFPQDALVEIMRRASTVQPGGGLVCRMCHLPATRLTSETCDSCFHKWAVKTKKSYMASQGFTKPKKEQRRRIQEMFLQQRGLNLPKGGKLWK